MFILHESYFHGFKIEHFSIKKLSSFCYLFRVNSTGGLQLRLQDVCNRFLWKKNCKKINLAIGLGQNNSILLLNFDKTIKYELIIWWNMPMHNLANFFFEKKKQTKQAWTEKRVIIY